MIRAAIVGIGTWGQNLVKSVQGKSERIRFVAGATGTPKKAEEFSKVQGLSLFSRYEDLLNEKDIEAVVLATPHSLHCEQIIAAAQAGKHVFVEKPLGLDRKDAERAVDACAKHGVVLAVGYNWRFQPALREIKAMLEDGRLGKLVHIEGNFCGPSAYRFKREHWRQDRDEVPAGGMTGRGVHVVDAMLYLAGRVETVVAQSRRLVQDFGVDDTTSMLFGFKGGPAVGPTGYLGTFIATAETWRLQVFGSRGWAEVGDVEHLTTWQLKACFLKENILEKEKPQITTFPSVSTERAELEHFADAVAVRRPIAVPGGDEVHNVAVFDAIVRSIQTDSRQSIP
jgi:predicted dehydrogenase